MSGPDAERKRTVTGRQAALAGIADRRRRDPNWAHRTDPTYVGPHPIFVPLMSDAEFDRKRQRKCMIDKRFRCVLRKK